MCCDAQDWARNPADHATITGHGQWRQAVQAYLASISFCDRQVGRVLQALQESPVADSTTVVLWSDNGFHLGEKLHWRKFTLWEEATRVPFVLVPAADLRRAPQPQIVDEPVSVMDLFPTLFALEQLPLAPGCGEAQSLLPLLQQNQGAHAAESASPRSAALTSWQRGNHSLRWRQWRYTRYHTGDEELYDLEADPREWHNLVVRDRLSADQQRALDRLRREMTRRAGPAPTGRER